LSSKCIIKTIVNSNPNKTKLKQNRKQAIVGTRGAATPKKKFLNFMNAIYANEQ
jgi:hypothetical protein